MVELTIQSAKVFHDSCMEKITDNEFSSLITSHSIAVGELAIVLSKGKFGEDLYRIAGLVHDIGYCVAKDSHAKHSLSLLQEAGYAISDELKDCILNHGSKNTTVTMEGKFFQLADKLSMFKLDLVTFWLKGFEDPFSKKFLELLHKKVDKLDILFE